MGHQGYEHTEGMVPRGFLLLLSHSVLQNFYHGYHDTDDFE